VSVPSEVAKTLLANTNAMRELYHPDVQELHDRVGSNVNKLLRPSKRPIDGDGVTVQVQDRNIYAARYGRSINGDFPDPGAIGHQKYKVRISEDDSENDVGRLSTSVSHSDLDVQRVSAGGKSAVDNWVEQNFQQAVADLKEQEAKHQFLDTTGLIGEVNGTAVKNDRALVSECAALASTGGARFKVKTGSLAYFQRNMKLDVYNGGTFRFSVYVTDINPRDLSVGVYGYDAAGNPSTSVDISALADGDDIYISGEKDRAPIGIGSWMTRPTAATGDSFFQKNREDPDYRWMVPHFSGPTSEEAFALAHLDAAAIEAQYLTEDAENGLLCMARPEIIETWKRLVGNEIMIQYPTDAEKGKVLASYGFDGAIYRHETFGRLMLRGVALMPEKKIWMVQPGTWEMLHALRREKIRWMEGMVGIYYRMTSPSNNGSLTTYWRADGYTLHAVICSLPKRNLVIEKIRPTATVSAA